MTANVIGSLRHRVVLERQVVSPTDDGGATITWQSVSGLFARIEPAAGREVVVADGLAARISHKVLIRHIAGIEPHMRFVEGTRVLDIHAVRDLEGRRRWVECLCEEQLP